MAEYIEREEVREAFYMEFDEDYADDIIDRLPASDVQEVRHGKWIKSKNERKCPICGYFYFTNIKSFNYCPNCGAKMDKE